MNTYKLAFLSIDSGVLKFILPVPENQKADKWNIIFC